MTGYVLRAIVALLALAALAAIAWVVARRYSSPSLGRDAGHLSVLEVLPLSVSARLLLVRAGKRVFLLSLTGQSASVLAELTPDDLSDDASDPDDAHADT